MEKKTFTEDQVRAALDKLTSDAEASILFHQRADENCTEYDEEERITTRQMHRQHITTAKAWRTRVDFERCKLGLTD